MEIVKAAIAAGLVLAVLDGLWLGLVARGWLARQLGGRLRQPIYWPAGIAFYLIYSAGLGFFAVTPAMTAGGDVLSALGLGALLGLVAYGTYDLTNLATLKDWPRTFAMVDLVWGAAVSAASAAGAVLILKMSGLG